jgi:hypothetical protein
MDIIQNWRGVLFAYSQRGINAQPLQFYEANWRFNRLNIIEKSWISIINAAAIITIINVDIEMIIVVADNNLKPLHKQSTKQIAIETIKPNNTIKIERKKQKNKKKKLDQRRFEPKIQATEYVYNKIEKKKLKSLKNAIKKTNMEKKNEITVN